MTTLTTFVSRLVRVAIRVFDAVADADRGDVRARVDAIESKGQMF